MAELATLARPYAKAAFDHASERNALGPWAHTLGALGAYLVNAELAAYLKRPDLTPNQQVDALVAVLGGNVGAAFRNFLTLLAENGRLGLLPEISAEFNRLKAQSTQQIDVSIDSAFALSDEQLSLLTGRLQQRFGKQVNAQVTVRPELISGVVIRAGDQVIDDSALGKLAKMKLSLLA